MSIAGTVLEVNNLVLERGGAEVLRVPSFALHEQESVALIGPNGAGKSSLLLALAGLLEPSAGEILFRGVRAGSQGGMTAYRRRIAMVFQEPLLFNATVYDNVAAGLKIRHLPRTEIRERVEGSLERFRISHLAGRSARKLSSGEAQRTSLARAFAVGPEVILLDEPFVALDPPTRQALMDDLERVLRESGTAALIATHDRQEALRLADRMVMMHAGEIVQCGPTAEVMSRPANAFVATFVGNGSAGGASAAEDCVEPVTPPSVSFVAKSGTGKTTLLEKVIAELKLRGWRVGVIKHDAHRFDIDHPGKDSYRLAAAGADTMLISSPEKLAMVKRHAASPPIRELIATYFGDVDIVLTEGFKQSDLPKIEVNRSERSRELLCRGEKDDPTLIAIASDAELSVDVPVFHINDHGGIAGFIEQRFLWQIAAPSRPNPSFHGRDHTP